MENFTKEKQRGLIISNYFVGKLYSAGIDLDKCQEIEKLTVGHPRRGELINFIVNLYHKNKISKLELGKNKSEWKNRIKNLQNSIK